MSLASAAAAALKRWTRSVSGRTMSPSPDRYLFIPINGAGLGHLSRCLAIAGALRKAHPQSEITFFTTSLGVPLIRRAGYRCYHLPSANTGAMTVDVWNRTFRDLLMSVMEAHQPATVVFDGTWPYEGLKAVMRCCGRVRFVWVRRGLHKHVSVPDARSRQADLFSTTVVPGELGSINDDVPPGVVRVDPIVVVDPDDLLSRDAVRSRLGLNPSASAVYVQLGAGNINDVEEIEASVVDALKDIPDLEVVLARSPIMQRDDRMPHAAMLLTQYPNALYFRGFDAAVLAAGYNSVYEALACRLPAVFVPNESTGSDDQVRRAGAAAGLRGWVSMSRWTGDELRRSVESLIALEGRVEDAGQSWQGAAQVASLLAQAPESTGRRASA